MNRFKWQRELRSKPHQAPYTELRIYDGIDVIATAHTVEAAERIVAALNRAENFRRFITKASPWEIA